MQIRFVMLALAPLLGAGCTGVRSTRAERQDFLLSFPHRLNAGEQVVAFEFNARNSDIVAVNKVSYDWLINMLSEAAGANMSGFPNHGASAFQNTAPLQRFVTIHKNSPEHFDITGSIVVTRDFKREWTNYFTKPDFILERAASNKDAPNAAPPHR